jgi:ABC-type uncharacterized transport system involved in gliding motility auxiliary subunit
MGRNIQYLGLLGLVVFVFGLLTYFLVSFDEFYFMQIHAALGLLLILSFIFKGGFKPIGSAAVKRAAGFGAGVTLYSALFLGMLLLINFAVVRYDPLFFDSTEQDVYTLAPQTVSALDGLEEPIVIRAFVVGGRIGADLEDILNRYSRASSMVRWLVVDPETEPALTAHYGINERDTIHFSFEREESTRAVKISRSIDEQSLTNAILKLTRGGKKLVYWISGHGESNLDDGGDAGFLFLKEAIEGENVEVKMLTLSGGEHVPDDAAAILFMAPRRPLLIKERNAIRRYLKAGGNAMLLTEPNTTNEIANLAKPLGIVVGDDIVLDQEVRLLEGKSVGVRPMITDYGQHPITEEFGEGTIFSTASSVRTAPVLPQGATVSELAFTSSSSWGESQVSLVFSERPVAALDPEDIRGPLAIAAVFEGPAPYEIINDEEVLELRPEEEVGLPSKSSETAASLAKSRIAVFGDADFVANVNIRQLFNRDFFLNSLNWVLGQEGGVSIRARTLKCSTKGLTVKEFRSIFLVSGILLPECVMIWGLTVWWRRQRR